MGAHLFPVTSMMSRFIWKMRIGFKVLPLFLRQFNELPRRSAFGPRKMTDEDRGRRDEIFSAASLRYA
jgi:hypothetical protein